MRALRLTALLLPALWLSGCDEFDFDSGPSDRYKEDFHFSHALPQGGRVTVENANGAIEISTWEKNEVEVNGTKFAKTEEMLREIKIEFQPSSGAVSVRTIQPSRWRGGGGARYFIRVPRRADLERITSSNGGIRVDGVEGNASLRTSNGAIRTTATKGMLDARTSNGGVELKHTGSVEVHTSNGSIRADVERGAFTAETSNGSITARLTDADANAPVRMDSSNGSIDLTTNAPRDVRASTSNSSLTVRIPANAGARLRAHTSNASITTDFDVAVRGVQGKHNLEGTIGGGGPLLDLSSTNGGIKVLKY